MMTFMSSASRHHLNECPHEIPRFLLDDIQCALAAGSRYPIGYEQRVNAYAANFYGVEPENVLFTNGVDDCVDRIARYFKQMRFVYATPGFDGYWQRLKLFTDNALAIALSPEDFTIDRNDLKRFCQSDMVLIANPSNPTGNAFCQHDLEEIRKACGYLFLDRTYRHYSQRKKISPLERNQLTYHSLSKAYGLAGFRLGVVVGPKNEIEGLRELGGYCALSTVSLALIESALKNETFFLERACADEEERNRLFQALQAMGLSVRNTETNFLLIKTFGRPYQERLQQENILVKDTGQYGLQGHLRISVGLKTQNDRLISTIARIHNTFEAGNHVCRPRVEPAYQTMSPQLSQI
jgi:histidinol-phosphate aminotransferase